MPIPSVHLPKIRDYENPYEREAKAAIKALDASGVRRLTVTGVVLTTTTALVSHGLGKRPVGWLIIDKNAQADIWRDPLVEVTADKIPLRASATVTCDIQFW